MLDQNKLKADIQRIMQVFIQNENGNKITQFNMMGLTNMLMGVIDGTVVIQQGPPPVAGEQQVTPAGPIETHRVEMPLEEIADEETKEEVIELTEETKEESAGPDPRPV